MQILKDEVRKSIEDAAIKTFKEHGYVKASMRSIADEAGMSVGNLYRYYKNKETLFGMLVQPMIDFFERSQVESSMKFKFEMLEVNMLEHSVFIEQLMAARMDFRDELFILFLRAEGSRYEGARETFRAFIEEKTAEFFEENGISYVDTKKYRTFIKASAASVVEAFCVNLEQSETESDFLMNMLLYMELVVKPAVRNLFAIRDKKTSFRRISDEEILRHFDSHRTNSHRGGTQGNGGDESGK